MASQALFCALELGIFDHLASAGKMKVGERAKLESVSEKLGVVVGWSWAPFWEHLFNETGLRDKEVL